MHSLEDENFKTTENKSNSKPYKRATSEKKCLPDTTNAIVLLNALLGNDLNFKNFNPTSNKPPFIFSIIVDGVEYVGEGKVYIVHMKEMK